MTRSTSRPLPLSQSRRYALVALLLAASLAPAERLGVTEVFREGFEGDTSAWTVPGEILEDAKQAHSGARCHRGEATRPNQSVSLLRPIQLDPSRVYALSLWARSPKRCRLAIWARKGGDRFMIGIVKAVNRQWQSLKFSFTPPTAGEWTLEIIAPASHGGAPLGDMLTDDLLLTETTLPPSTQLSQGQRYAQYPAVAVAPDGTTWTAWQTFADGRDALWAARLQEGPEGLTVAERWEVPLPGKGYALRPALAAGSEGVYLAAPVEVAGNWNVYAWPLTVQGPGKQIDLAATGATETQPALTAAGSTTWAAWVSNDGGRRSVYAAPIRGGAVGAAERLSSPDSSNYSPSLAGSPDGRAWVAWDSFRTGGYDLWLNSFDGQRWTGERQLTTSPLIEHRASLAHGNGSLWVAWEAGEYSAYKTNAFGRKAVFVAQVGPEGLRAPKPLAHGLSPWIEKPALTVDARGRPWLTVRRSRSQNAGWEVVLYAVDSEQPGLTLCATPGRARPVSLTTTASQVVVALEADNYGKSYVNTEEATAHPESEVRLAALDFNQLPPAEPSEWAPVDFGDTPLNIDADRAQFGEELPASTIEYNGQTLHLFYGDFHDHSDISQCNRRGDLAPDDNYAHNRDIHRLDFAAITDHGYNLTPPLWQLTAENARANTDPGRFLAFLGEEWTSTFEEYSAEHPFGFYGHRNLIFADAYFPRWFNARDRSTPTQVWDRLRAMRANFIQIPHQLADNGNVPTDWNYTDEVAQPVAEIYQTRGSYEYRNAPGAAKNLVPQEGHFLQDAWARGIVIGVIASPDHGGGRGKAAVYAPSLDREAILDAMRQRHTFGTSGARIFLDFRVNGHLMGEKLPKLAAGQPVTLTVSVRSPQPLASVDLCRSNEFIFSKPKPGKTCDFTFRDDRPLTGASYYYCRAVQEDGQLAWTSPVWLGAPSLP